MSIQEMDRSTRRTSKKPQVAIMNAVHDLPVLAARDLGYFKDEGLDIDFIVTPGMSQVTTKHFVTFETVFDRPLDSVYNEGGIDQYRMAGSLVERTLARPSFDAAFAAPAFVRAMLDFESALARAQAAEGVIPAPAAEAVARA